MKASSVLRMVETKQLWIYCTYVPWNRKVEESGLLISMTAEESIGELQKDEPVHVTGSLIIGAETALSIPATFLPNWIQ
jgi:hypothetical protein